MLKSSQQRECSESLEAFFARVGLFKEERGFRQEHRFTGISCGVGEAMGGGFVLLERGLLKKQEGG